MRPRFPALVCALVALTTTALPLAAQTSFRGANLHELGVSSTNLQKAFDELREQTEGLAWVAYEVPMANTGRTLCCGDLGRCSLERKDGFYNHRQTTVDASRDLTVLLRLSERRLSDVRIVSDDCGVDAPGIEVYALGRLEASDSFDFLRRLISASSHKLAERALVAVAHHREPRVDGFLEELALGKASRLEDEAIFWLGEARGDRGFETLRRLRSELTATDLREQLAFALHLNLAEGALPMLIDMARNDRHPKVRAQALFWLAQEAGEREAAVIADAAEEDPEIEVKERAVFALSQMPADRGVPLLIRYAQTHPQPRVRKQAMFWLGQTGDKRALDFIEEVLTR